MLLWCCYGVVIMIKEYYDENKIKSAFFNVKKDILEIKNEIEEIKRLLLKKEEKITNNKNNSIGNDGVVIMPLLSRYYDVVMPRKESDHKIEVKDLKILDKEIKSFIISLTDKEFLIFLAIYQLEDELNRPVTYEDLSKKLKISSRKFFTFVVGLFFWISLHKCLSISVSLSIRDIIRYLLTLTSICNSE